MKFIKAGLQTSIQDLGRLGLMHLGIAQSGAMDPDSIKMANWLVNKPTNSAVIEITVTGPEIEFSQNMCIAVCGAEFDISLNKKPQLNNQTIQVTAGDRLKFGKRLRGNRAYLAISGELNLPLILSSFSTHLTAQFGGYHGRQLKDGDTLELLSIDNPTNRIIPEQFRITYSGKYLIRCVPSIESSDFSKELSDYFYSQNYAVSPDSNRMGVRLNCDSVGLRNDLQITSSGLTQGSIQIPPSGQPIISSVDGQTIGGYPRIANVCSADISLLGQLTAGDKINFVLIERNYAIQILKEKQHKTSFMRSKL